MKKLLFISTVLFISCAFAPQKKTKVIFFGDSITELGVKKDRYPEDGQYAESAKKR
jgi:hypothetical protein